MAEAYDDRAAAGGALTDALEAADLDLLDPVVLGLPRGGVPVARVVADRLDADLDVLVVRKIGAPGHEELGLGAIGERGVEVLDEESMRRYGVSRADLEPTIVRERDELARRVRRYRGDRDRVDVAGRDAVVVDDGIATGVTASAALQVVRQWGPRRVILAVPVASGRGLAGLRDAADEVICPQVPEGFRAVGLWYRDFHQVSDDEVVEHLERRRGGRAG